MIAAIILFVINYSRTIVVRYELDGAQQKSNVERNVADTSYLQEAGEQMQIMKLQGYMFFGTVSDLEEKLNRRADDENKAPLRYAVLDFAQVTGIDSSAALSFMKMAQQAARVPYFLVLTGLQPDFRDRLERSGFNAALSGFIRFERDLDHGIEWCEEQILEGHADGHEFVPGDFLKQIDEVLATPGDGEIFRQYLELRHVQAGEVLTEQGDTSDTMFLMDTAAASVYLELDGEPHRVRRTHSGTVFGELGFYMHTPRSATVIADVEGDVYLLSHAALEKMEREHPQITAAFQTFMIRILSRRLLNTTRTLETLLK